jgi:hypothetical protein
MWMYWDRSAFSFGSSWKKTPARFEAFLNDHLGARSYLLDWHARMKLDGLSISSCPRVLLGSNGWLYFYHQAEVAPENLEKSSVDLSVERWSEVVRYRRDWCQQRGIAFLTVVVPDKQTIYPEHLPPAVAHRQDQHIWDRIAQRWAADPPVSVVDLRHDYLASKSILPLYRLTDTHWTPYGCWRAYFCTVQAMAKTIPSLKPIEWDEFFVAESPIGSGDLWRLLGMRRQPPDEICAWPFLRQPLARRSTETVALTETDRLDHLRPVIWERMDGAGPRVVLLCDSFADDRYQEMLAQHCSRLVVVPTYLMSKPLIERERPDIVICQMVERIFVSNRPELPKR